ncbi:hypothetical protein Ms3S1_37830 [Methylosinus sp. 3S-1]
MECDSPPCRVAAGARPTTALTSFIEDSSETTYIDGRINYATGNSFWTETDYTTAGNFPIVLARYYNSQRDPFSQMPSFGDTWSSSYSRSITLTKDIRNWVEYHTALVTRDDGRILKFKRTVWVTGPEPWSAPANSSYRLEGGGGGEEYRLITDKDETEIYNTSGQLISVTDRTGVKIAIGYDGLQRLSTVSDVFGRTLTFTYNGASFQISEARTPDGGVYRYEIDWTNFQLKMVQFPDQSKRYYQYDRSLLADVLDENGSNYAHFSYDQLGHAVSTESGDGAGKYSLDYSGLPSNSVTVTTPLGAVKNFNFVKIDDLAKTLEVRRRICATCPTVLSDARTYDDHGNLTSYTDFNGNRTTIAYDGARHLPTSKTVAAGTAVSRTITTEWRTDFRLPAKISDYQRETTFTYDAKGNLLTETVASGSSSSTRSYTYNTFGQVLTATDPLGRVTKYAYDAMGNLTSETNPRGHVTAYTSYDANGRPLTIQDPNGVVTTLTYNFRGQITSRVTLGQTTTYTYDKAGQLIKVREPSGAGQDFGYDGAHRLTDMRDRAGNHRIYTLDAAGGRIKEEVFDPNGALLRTHSRTYDSYERLSEDFGAAGQASKSWYDANDRVISSKDKNGNVTNFTYDEQNRLTETRWPDARKIRNAYDANGRLASVTDPRGLVTRYAYNFLDLREKITSPDTHVTTKTYDAAGNVLTSTDALGQTTTYLYDQLGRVVKATYADGSKATYVYDQGDYGIGRLTSMTDSTGTTSFAYDAFGHVVQKTQTIGAVSFTTKWYYHATNGRLIGHTYPSGFKLLYSYDSIGRVSAITLQQPDGTTRSTLIGAISYGPFGLVTSWDPNVSGGGSYVRKFDLDGRIKTITSPTGNRLTYAFDPGGRITSISESNLAVKSFSYDVNDRLTSYVRGSNSILYEYDATGNRTSAGDAAYTIVPTSNRMSDVTYSSGTTQSFVWDQVGGLRNQAGVFSLSYDARNRLVAAKVGALTTSYGVNDLGQRVTKNGASGLVEYVYDLSGHIIGTYDASGAATEEIVWLGDLPAATLQGGAVYFIMPDHLGAPHEIVNAANARVWFWDHDPFGNGTPTAAAGFSHDLRFPGQIYDSETRLHNNGFRDYSPALGRYVQSDPIGLDGGINTYAYAKNNPLNLTDPTGNNPIAVGILTCAQSSLCSAAVAAIGTWWGTRTIAVSQGDRYLSAPPPPNEGDSAPHGAADHNKAIDDKVAEIKAEGARDIRKNQAQVDAEGNKVGSNRPDLQWTDSRARRHVLEVGRNNARLQRQKDRISCNDPNCDVTTKYIGQPNR